MGYILANLWPILAATGTGLLIGIGYAWLLGGAPALLGRPLWLILAILAEFWLAAILAGALIVAPVQVGRWVVAIGSAIVIWLGFVVPTLVTGYGFRSQGAGAAVGDALHWLAVMVAQSVVLQAIGLTHP